MKYRPLAVTAALSLAVVLPVQAQSRQDRVDQISDLLATAAQADRADRGRSAAEAERTATPRQLMRATLTDVRLDEVPARMALEMWSLQTDVPIVINWPALENAGVDTEQPVTLNLRAVPAEQALELILRQMHPDPIGTDALLFEVTEWYVQIQTKEQALRNSTTKMYFIGDLLMDIPDFEGPNFDLNEALSNTNSGGSGNGGGGGGQQGLFDEDDNDADEVTLTREERAEQIADIVRDTIEPEIWEANGGEYASVRYYRGMLVVKAPQYVHDQIGVPTSTETTRRTARSSRDSDRSDRSANRRTNRRSGGVAGTSTEPRRVR